MIRFPNSAAGKQLASSFRNAQENSPESLAITVINKYGSTPDNTGIGTLANREKLNEFYRAQVDSLLENGEAPRAKNGSFVGDLDPAFVKPRTHFDDLARLEELTRKKTKEDLDIPLSDFNPIVSNLEEPSMTVEPKIDPPDVPKPLWEKIKGQWEGMDTPQQEAAIDSVTNIAKTIIESINAPDVEEATSVAPRPNFGKLRQIKNRPIGPAQYTAHGGSVLGRKLFVGGGEVDGPGGPKEDLVPIWASDEEYVVSANGVKRLGKGNHSKGIAALDRINFGKK
tara:strand:+ start:1992 stop:2840 length:849 start_codon:yes stop_codon:yes gene_type:complete